MSVFTSVSREQLAVWLEAYDLGAPTALVGIAEGVQNSNFFVDTERGRHVLTLFERGVDAALLPFYLDLMAHLAQHGIPCPAPRPMRDGRLLGELNGRPAALFSRLAGASVLRPTPAQCAAAGAALARLHLAGRDFPAPPHPRGSDWVAATAARLRPLLPAADAALLADELAAQGAPAAALPAGVIHADLFRDNVLFVGDGDAPRIGGLLDFYFAGRGDFLFDLAIVANDWCDDDGGLDAIRLQPLLAAYHAARPLTAAELAAWPRQLRAAALRFWLSRLEDFHCPQPGETVTVRDPDAYRRILLARRALGDAPLRLA
ncbi:homoserine kinase [Azospira restricta]|uniref:Homoserine kinase n=1 Tax=Azospira restricta TaxID=404405 RepID=A0A974SPM5_9RHOO|nr:homoserine kinase [Azospira restricta]QRJ64121.1 homoserine kinase [Azospira restricta]